jgi:hypothetical protein
MSPLIRRALTLWRAYRARKVWGPKIAGYRAQIEQARKRHKPRAHLLRRLRDARCAQLRMEQGIR